MMIKKLALSSISLAILFGTLQPQEAYSARTSAKITSMFGKVQMKYPQKSWKRAIKNRQLSSGSSVRTGRRSRTELRYSNGSRARLGSNTLVRVKGTGNTKVVRGKTWIKKPKNAKKMKIRTPSAVATVVGTELFVSHNGEGVSHVTTFTGSVEVENMRGERALVPAGHWVEIEPDKPLEKPTKFDWDKLRKKERFLLDPNFIPGEDDIVDEEDWR